jgi:hypothetical protein
MALAPAYKMAMEEPKAERKPLAVMKVLVRNSARLQEVGGKKAEVLKPVKPGKLDSSRSGGEQLRDAARKADMNAAEATFAAICASGTPADALNELLIEVDEATEVHRVVLVSRAWDMINFVGAERARERPCRNGGTDDYVGAAKLLRGLGHIHRACVDDLVRAKSLRQLQLLFSDIHRNCSRACHTRILQRHVP